MLVTGSILPYRPIRPRPSTVLRSPCARRRANSRAHRSMARTSSRPAIVRRTVPLVSVHRLLDDAWNRVKLRRDCRNSATAISLAAFNTIGSPASPARARNASARQGKRTVSGGANSRRPARVRSSGSERRAPPLRIGERVLDGQAHVGHAELRDDRTVDELDHRMDDRLGMDRRRRSDAGPTANSQCASITSRPLFINVAESIVIFGPILHVGCRSASSGVTCGSLAAGSSRNGPPDAVRMRRRISRASRPCRHW